MRKATEGFTLIEIMIVVAIVAILSAIAIPSYRDYIQRGKLVTATNNLQSFQSAMEQYYQDNRTYLNATSGGFISPCGAGGTVAGTAITGWTFSCPALTSVSYTVQASGTPGLTSGFVYQINQAGTASTTRLPSNWPQGALPAACFITKKGMTC
jgi:type IV pilus assembly protein PilE